MKDTLKLVLLFLFFSVGSSVGLFGQTLSDCFTLRLSSETVAAPSETVCLDVSVTGFSQMLGMQYSMHWNPAELQFVSVTNIDLPGLVYTSSVPGRLPFTWTDQDVQGVTKPDGTVIYSVCFQVLSGTSPDIWFDETPTPIEFVTGMPLSPLQEIEDYALLGGSILVATGAEVPMTLESACTHAEGSCADGFTLEAIPAGGTPPYTWSWTGPNFTSAAVAQVNNVPAGTYRLTITDATGQTARVLFNTHNSGIEITDYTLIAAACNSGTQPGSISIEEVTGATGDITYLWSTGDQTASIEAPAPGFYTVTITDEAGCTVTQTFEVPGSAGFGLIEEINYPACTGSTAGAINLTPDPAGTYLFNWSNSATSEDLTGIESGIYHVTVTDTQSGCQLVNTYALNVVPVEVWMDVSDCDAPNDSVTVLAWPVQGAPPYSLQWSNGQTTSGPASISVPNIEDAVYSVTVTDAYGCTSLASTTVNCISGQATMNITGTTVNPGESFCLDVSIDNSIPVGAIALELNWNENVLHFDSITNLQMPVPNTAGWNNDEPGALNFLWANSTTPWPTQTQPALLMEVCFTALQPGTSNVAFSADASQTYLLEQDVFQLLALFTTGNTVTVNGSSQQAIGLQGTTTAAGQSDPACIQVKAANFSEVTALSYDMTWDNSQIEFTSIQNINPASELSLANFNFVSDGLIHLDWEAVASESMNLPNDAILYEVCFSATGAPGSYPVQWSNMEARRLNAIDLVVETIDGKVIIQEAGVNSYTEVTLAPGAIINAGESACLPVQVSTFDDIYALQFSIHWDPALVRLDSVRAADLPGLSTVSNFGYFPSDGNLTFSWIDPTLIDGTTLAEGASLFDLCFSAIGPSGISPVTFESEPTLIEVIDVNGVVPFLGQGSFIVVPDDNVWPGDADNNGHVDHFDLLPVGIAFSATGPQRPDASIGWVAQPAEDWAQHTPVSSINYKHMDTDGSGAVNQDDTLAISQNWGLSVNPFGPETPASEPREVGVPLYVLADTLAPSEVAVLDIMLGTSDQPAENVYGVAFSITYNPELIVPGSVSASFLNSWLGDQNNDLISMFRVSPTQDRIDIAMTRTNGLNNSGNGAIGKLHITIEDVIFQRNNTFRRAEFNVENIRLIGYDEVEIPVAPEMSTSWISVSTGTDNPALANSIRLYPTPTTDDLFITAEGFHIEGIQVLDQYGRVVTQFEQPDKALSVKHLAAGVYVARIATDRGIAYKTFVIAH